MDEGVHVLAVAQEEANERSLDRGEGNVVLGPAVRVDPHHRLLLPARPEQLVKALELGARPVRLSRLVRRVL